jgi:flagellar motor switch protein FliG
MSMLARFRKPGGVQQLVVLLESCLTKKREALLTTIEGEDKEFAMMVKAKVLTAARIFKWDPLVVSEATTKLGDRTLAIALKGLPPECVAIALHTSRDLKKRDIMNLLETIKPTPVEIESAHIKLVETVRTLEKEGAIKLDANDNPVAAATSASVKKVA